jgi:hypothetical protein
MKYPKVIIPVGILLLVVAGFLVWASNPSQPEDAVLTQARQLPGVNYGESKESFNLTRPDATTGFIFYPGGHVAAEAYVAKLAPLVQSRPVNVYIAKMPLSLAVFNVSAATKIREEHPELLSWSVGGHSLGGAMACRYVGTNPGKALNLILLASFCDKSIADSSTKVVSIVGEKDGLMNSGEIEKYTANVPSDTRFVVIPGMNHGQMGNYGKQPGDNQATISDQQAAQELLTNLQTVF